MLPPDFYKLSPMFLAEAAGSHGTGSHSPSPRISSPLPLGLKERASPHPRRPLKPCGPRPRGRPSLVQGGSCRCQIVGIYSVNPLFSGDNGDSACRRTSAFPSKPFTPISKSTVSLYQMGLEMQIQASSLKTAAEEQAADHPERVRAPIEQASRPCRDEELVQLVRTGIA